MTVITKHHHHDDLPIRGNEEKDGKKNDDRRDGEEDGIIKGSIARIPYLHTEGKTKVCVVSIVDWDEREEREIEIRLCTQCTVGMPNFLSPSVPLSLFLVSYMYTFLLLSLSLSLFYCTALIHVILRSRGNAILWCIIVFTYGQPGLSAVASLRWLATCLCQLCSLLNLFATMSYNDAKKLIRQHTLYSIKNGIDIVCLFFVMAYEWERMVSRGLNEWMAQSFYGVH